MGEEVVIVDRQNVVIGCALRSEMRQKKMIHRAAYILVFNKAGEIFIQKRTLDKDIYPGFYDVAAGGVVLSEESYEEAAQRELYEELGVYADLTCCFDHFYSDQNNSVWGRIYTCVHEGPFTLQKEEVEEGFFMAIENVASFRGDHDFTPDGIEIFEQILAGTKSKIDK